jgi:hypothetical protein
MHGVMMMRSFQDIFKFMASIFDEIVISMCRSTVEISKAGTMDELSVETVARNWERQTFPFYFQRGIPLVSLQDNVDNNYDQFKHIWW